MESVARTFRRRKTVNPPPPPSSTKNYVSKVTQMKRLERAKTDSIINRLRIEPGETNDAKGSRYIGHKSTTMSGLPWKIRDQIEGKIVGKTSSEILSGRPQVTNFVFAYGNTNDDEIVIENEKPKSAPIKVAFATSHKPVKTTAGQSRIQNIPASSVEPEDIYYRDWAERDNQYLEHSKKLINTTKNILEKAGLTRSSHDSDMSPYLEALENMDMKQLDPETVRAQELKEQEAGIQAFTKISPNKMSTARIQPRVYYTKSKGSSKLTIGPASKSKKNVRINDPEPPITNFVPTYNLRLMEKEETIDRSRDGMNDPQKFQEYARKKRELMEAALQAYDPDSPTYDVLSDINDTTLQDDSDHLEATTEALTLLYGALDNQTKRNKSSEEAPKTTLHVSKLPAQSDAEILENSVFRPLDHFKGSVIGAVLREIKETEDIKPPRQYSATFHTTDSKLLSQRPTRKESLEKLEGLRIIENFRLSKIRQRKKLTGITIAPNTFATDLNDDSEPSYLIVNKVPTPGPRSRPGHSIMKNSELSQFTTGTSNRVQQGSTKTTSRRNGGAGSASSRDTSNVESLSSLKPARGSEIDMNLRTNIPIKLNKVKKDQSIRGAEQHKTKQTGKGRVIEVTGPETSKGGKNRQNFGHRKKN